MFNPQVISQTCGKFTYSRSVDKSCGINDFPDGCVYFSFQPAVLAGKIYHPDLFHTKQNFCEDTKFETNDDKNEWISADGIPQEKLQREFIVKNDDML